MSIESRNQAELIAPDMSNATLITRYFRDVGAHQVMSPDEEVQCAKEFEQAEVRHWVALLAFLPIADWILERLVQDMKEAAPADRPDVPQVGALQELTIAYRKRHSKLSVGQRRSWHELSAALARHIRRFDHDRQWVAHAIEAAERGGPTQPDASGASAIARTPGYMGYLAHARETDARCREAKN